MKYDISVIRNTDGMGHTQKETIADFDSADEAVKFAKSLKRTEYTWYTVEIDFEHD